MVGDDLSFFRDSIIFVYLLNYTVELQHTLFHSVKIKQTTSCMTFHLIITEICKSTSHY